MMKFTSLAITTAVAALLLAGPASAQTTAPAAPAAKSAPATTAAPATAPKAKAERSAASLECSKQADAKGLHGKARHKFRAECKKSGGKAM
ncbi:MAG: phosphate starvation-inducible protein PsiF [Rhizobiales bacterium]|nr:phosphate starvation-inducible protein PsiF [Hyphomicrobiales bacterium]